MLVVSRRLSYCVIQWYAMQALQWSKEKHKQCRLLAFLAKYPFFCHVTYLLQEELTESSVSCFQAEKQKWNEVKEWITNLRTTNAKQETKVFWSKTKCMNCVSPNFFFLPFLTPSLFFHTFWFWKTKHESSSLGEQKKQREGKMRIRNEDVVLEMNEGRKEPKCIKKIKARTFVLFFFEAREDSRYFLFFDVLLLQFSHQFRFRNCLLSFRWKHLFSSLFKVMEKCILFATSSSFPFNFGCTRQSNASERREVYLVPWKSKTTFAREGEKDIHRLLSHAYPKHIHSTVQWYIRQKRRMRNGDAKDRETLRKETRMTIKLENWRETNLI